MLNFIKKYCYISMPIITLILILILYFGIFPKINYVFSFDDTKISTLIEIAGALIGFLFASITIFMTLPKENIIIQRAKKYNHHIIFSRCIFGGLILLFLSIFMWIFDVENNLILLFTILGLVETLIAAYYIYKLSSYCS